MVWTLPQAVLLLPFIHGEQPGQERRVSSSRRAIAEGVGSTGDEHKFRRFKKTARCGVEKGRMLKKRCAGEGGGKYVCLCRLYPALKFGLPHRSRHARGHCRLKLRFRREFW
jgi:hypothetical protein